MAWGLTVRQQQQQQQQRLNINMCGLSVVVVVGGGCRWGRKQALLLLLLLVGAKPAKVCRPGISRSAREECNALGKVPKEMGQGLAPILPPEVWVPSNLCPTLLVQG